MALLEDVLSGKEVERILNKPDKWDFAKQISTGITVRVEGFKKKQTIASCFWTDDIGRRFAEIPIEDLIKIHISPGHTVIYRKGPKQDRLMKVNSIVTGKARCYWRSRNKIISEMIPIEELRWTNTYQFDIGDQAELIAEQAIDKCVLKRVSEICEYHLYITCIDAQDDTLDSFSAPTLHYFEDLNKC